MTAQTPMLRQYFAVRAENPGVLLAMRVGDFYEFYGEDAETAATALEITLTGREDGSNGRIPMAGVPFHAIERYLARLLQKGLRVALCEQLEDPKAAKGLVRRGVTRVLTPGTLVEDAMLDAGRNQFLAAVHASGGRVGLAVLDPSTGEFSATELDEAASDVLLHEIARLRPAELLHPKAMDALAETVRTALGTAVTEHGADSPDRAARRLCERFGTAGLGGFGLDERPAAVAAAAMVLGYAERNHLALDHVGSIHVYSVDGCLRLDPATRRSLELTQNLADGGRRHTLLSVLDETATPMGCRRLRRWVDEPLLDVVAIRERQDAVRRLLEQPLIRADVRDALKRAADLERLVSRAATGLAGPRDLAALRDSLAALPDLEDPLLKIGLGLLQGVRERIGDHRDVQRVLARALVDAPPHALRDGGVIREGHDPELDALRELSRGGKSFIASLEKRERERSGIGSLKVGFNSVFGYFLEIPKRDVERAPADYIRKQTTAGAERYITAELKDQESRVLGAEEKATALEADLFARLRRSVGERSGPLLETARALAELDALASLAEVAARRGYVSPELTEDDVIEIEEGRHPVVETAGGPAFVANGTRLGDPVRLVVLTGPNMAGKSTYLRQTALIVLMAQIGSFVPARSARIGVCDRVFARIGAKDELALGQSTFMVEMLESANILNNATPRSLVILDEVGRGTSTYDGLAIAWAMVEHLEAVGAKTLFATHYHQLNALAEGRTGIANFRVAVQERGDEIVWTHRVVPGGADRSYGIHVARMAGVPAPVLRRAGEVLADLERTEAPKPVTTTKRLQLSLFEAEPAPVQTELEALDVDRLTPVEALRTLDDWKRRFGRG